MKPQKMIRILVLVTMSLFFARSAMADTTLRACGNEVLMIPVIQNADIPAAKIFYKLVENEICNHVNGKGYRYFSYLGGLMRDLEATKITIANDSLICSRLLHDEGASYDCESIRK